MAIGAHQSQGGDVASDWWHHEGAPIDDERLRSSVAIGDERSMDQDPAFAFRLLVDIASKALSPGVNDPGTAIQALDQIEPLHELRAIAPQPRHAAVDAELALLEASVSRAFHDDVDRREAHIGDRQGIGSPHTRDASIIARGR